MGYHWVDGLKAFAAQVGFGLGVRCLGFGVEGLGGPEWAGSGVQGLVICEVRMLDQDGVSAVRSSCVLEWR